MCGIIGILNSDHLTDELIEGLKRLEYRGYDSAGIVLCTESGLWLKRCAKHRFSIDELRKSLDRAPKAPVSGVGHTRWATHGVPIEKNAHPQVDCSNEIAVVHNGIIDNYLTLKNSLIQNGHRFESETDTEVISHLLEENYEESKDPVEAFIKSVAALEGAFSIVALFSEHRDMLLCAKKISPLILGRSNSSFYVASDLTAFLGLTDEVWALEDDQVGVLSNSGMKFYDFSSNVVMPRALKVSWSKDSVEKAGFSTHMLKEIFEQPQALSSSCLNRNKENFYLDEIKIPVERILNAQRIVLVGCGSSYNASLLGKIYFEKFSKKIAAAEIASEFRYSYSPLDENTLVVFISQSGETIDTLQALKHAKEKGALTLCVTNVIDSALAREADGVFYTKAGPEIGVAATKTFVCQVLALLIMAKAFQEHYADISLPEELKSLCEELRAKVKSSLTLGGQISEIAYRLRDIKDYLFLGRGLAYPVALEGALKLKEISYLHAEGYPAGELKHGPIAIIDEKSCVVGVSIVPGLRAKLNANLQEVKARGAKLVVVSNLERDEELESLGAETIVIPESNESLAPIISVVALQFFAYELARLQGNDVDKPRNLAKTVTVE